MQNKVTPGIQVISFTSSVVILMRKICGYPQHRGRVSRQSPRVRGGWLPPENILSHLFWKIAAWYGPKTYRTLLETPFPFKQKSGWSSDIWNFFSEKINSGRYFAENLHYQVGHVLLHHCDVIRWLIFMILVSMERGDPTPGLSNLQPMGHMRPARQYCTARKVKYILIVLAELMK